MLSGGDIRYLVEDGKLVIYPFQEDKIKCASVDLSLGEEFIRYIGEIDTRSDNPEYESFTSDEIVLKPGEFVLAATKERITIPDRYYGFIETRGNFARAGITVTCDDGHIDPGTDGVITLEIKNNNNVDVRLYSGDFICQLFLFMLTSGCSLYSGKYMNQDGPSVFKR